MSGFELEQIRSITVRGMDLIISSRRPGFDLSPHNDRFVLENVAMRQGSFPVRQFSPVSIIPPMLHTHYSTTEATQGVTGGTDQTSGGCSLC